MNDATVGERSHKNADAQSCTLSGVVPPNSAPLPNGDLTALAILYLLEEHTIGLRMVLGGVKQGELSPHVLEAIKDHASSCERLTGALEER